MGLNKVTLGWPQIQGKNAYTRCLLIPDAIYFSIWHWSNGKGTNMEDRPREVGGKQMGYQEVTRVKCFKKQRMVRFVERMLHVTAQRTRITVTKAVWVEWWKQKTVWVQVEEGMAMSCLWLEGLWCVMRHLGINTNKKWKVNLVSLVISFSNSTSCEVKRLSHRLQMFMPCTFKF